MGHIRSPVCSIPAPSLIGRGAWPLTLTLSPRAGRGDSGDCLLSLPAPQGRGDTEVLRHIPSPRARGEGGGSRMRGRHSR
ncbi:hypothetical protein AB395_00004173 [Sinorhizobium fredii CCBAU 45436]|nr:hypothetical protein SF83666_c39730 [Sinorhizobium fredii CCBAU 83666]AWI59797.1 hypothetical protein AB395_00004173 [Sinorhizobium fredii CCBAU 45436]